MTSREIATSAAGALFPLAAFLALVALLDYADWGEGPTRAAGLALGAAALAWSWASPPPWAAGRGPWLAVALAIALLRLAPSVAEGGRAGRPNDIGWTTARAVDALAAGRSPYASRIDPQRDLPREGSGLAWFMGYKYGPLVPRFYAPFLRALGMPRGLFAGNALLLVATALLAASLAWRVGGGEAALATGAALLWPQMIRHELFFVGVNDLLPTALGLLSLSFAAQAGRGGPGQAERPATLAFAAGAALGLSLSAKPLPGALLLLLLPGTVRARPFVAGLALGLVPYLPHLLATPRELVANLLLFNWARPGDTTGASAALPPWLAWTPAVLGLGLAAAAAVRYHRGARAPRDLVIATALVTTLFLAGGKIIHRNYLLWWLPLAATALGTAWYPRAASAPSRGSRP